MPLEYKYTLSDAVRLPLWGPALWGALWVYLIGRSPPAPLGACFMGCPLGIPYRTQSARPFGGLFYGVPFGYTLSDAVRLPINRGF